MDSSSTYCVEIPFRMAVGQVDICREDTKPNKVSGRLDCGNSAFYSADYLRVVIQHD